MTMTINQIMKAIEDGHEVRVTHYDYPQFDQIVGKNVCIEQIRHLFKNMFKFYVKDPTFSPRSNNDWEEYYPDWS